MKMTATWIQKTAVCAMAMAMAFSVVAQTKQVSAKVTRIKGSARYSTDGSTWKALSVGQSLTAPATIQTAAGSTVDLTLGQDVAIARTPRISESFSVHGIGYQMLTEQDVIRIFPDTMLAIDKLTVTPTGLDEIRETQLDLRAGKIFGRVKKLSAASRYEIKMPNGVAGIRGTIYSVTADGVVTVLSGQVVVAYVDANGQTQTQVVEAGYMFDVRNPQPPVPHDVPVPPGLTGLPAGFQEVPGDQTQVFVSPTTGTPSTSSSSSSSGGTGSEGSVSR